MSAATTNNQSSASAAIAAIAAAELTQAWIWKTGSTSSDASPLVPPLLLAPVGIHPTDLGNEMEDIAPEWSDYTIFTLSLAPGPAWGQVWNWGRGRRVSDGGTTAGWELARAIGVQFVPVDVAGQEMWMPRALNPDTWSTTGLESEEGDETAEAVVRVRGAAAVSLSPADAGRFEERGWLSWGSRDGIRVGDN